MIQKTSLFLLFLSLTFSALAAQYADAAENAYSAISTLGNTFELSIISETAEVMKPIPVEIAVSNKDGIPIAGAKISCSLTMPAMAMPRNMPPIKESEMTGQHEGVFLLTMGGLWNVEISAIYDSGEQDSVVIPIPVASSGQTGDSKIDTKFEELFHEQGSTEKNRSGTLLILTETW